MTALIVVESMFGNTRAVAQSVAAGLDTATTVEIVDVAGAPRTLPEGLTMLIVGAPTHALGMSRSSSRVHAVNQAATAAVETGIREWLGSLKGVRSDLPAAAFDTRVKRHGLPGSAAKAAVRRLRHLGCQVIVPPISFYVAGTHGRLLDSQQQRAESWGSEIGRYLQKQGHLAHP